NVVVSVKHRPPMRSLASRIANFFLVEETGAIDCPTKQVASPSRLCRSSGIQGFNGPRALRHDLRLSFCLSRTWRDEFFQAFSLLSWQPQPLSQDRQSGFPRPILG